MRSGNGSGAASGRSAAGEVRRHPRRERRAEDHAAGRGGPDRGLHLVGAGALEQVAGRAGPDRAEHGLVVLVHGQHHDPDAGLPAGDHPGGLDAVEVRHLDVHHHDVGHGLGDDVDRVAAVLGGADDLDARRGRRAGEASPSRTIWWSSTTTTLMSVTGSSSGAAGRGRRCRRWADR